jgi:hypothetical protein
VGPVYAIIVVLAGNISDVWTIRGVVPVF